MALRINQYVWLFVCSGCFEQFLTNEYIRVREGHYSYYIATCSHCGKRGECYYDHQIQIPAHKDDRWRLG
jgi:hypothetical protein